MVFREGEIVIFLDHQERSYLQKLKPEGMLQTHRGNLPHAALIGQQPGISAKTTQGKEFFILRPSLMDFMMNMPRKSGIIYPKDTAYLLLHTDVKPGSRVVTAGVGSGALLLALAQQVGPTGFVWGYDIRQDMLDFAAKNLESFMGPVENVSLELEDVYQNIPAKQVNTIILDVPEPWQCLTAVTNALTPGGNLAVYTPTIIQAESTCAALRSTYNFGAIETIEILIRDWHIHNRSVRPNHRMVGHTGFLTFARRIVESVPQVTVDTDGENSTNIDD